MERYYKGKPLLRGVHTSVVQKGMRLGMVLFIISEVMFFFTFFEPLKIEYISDL